MAATLEDLEKRVTAIEHELVMWRLTAAETPAERGARLWEQSLQEQAQITAAMEKAMEEMGITGEPIPAEELQKLFADCGVNPEDNEFSRGIIEMREE
jgi:hypothetical protein